MQSVLLFVYEFRVNEGILHLYGDVGNLSVLDGVSSFVVCYAQLPLCPLSDHIMGNM